MAITEAYDRCVLRRIWMMHSEMGWKTLPAAFQEDQARRLSAMATLQTWLEGDPE